MSTSFCGRSLRFTTARDVRRFTRFTSRAVLPSRSPCRGSASSSHAPLRVEREGDVGLLEVRRRSRLTSETKSARPGWMSSTSSAFSSARGLQVAVDHAGRLACRSTSRIAPVLPRGDDRDQLERRHHRTAPPRRYGLEALALSVASPSGRVCRRRVRRGRRPAGRREADDAGSAGTACARRRGAAPAGFRGVAAAACSLGAGGLLARRRRVSSERRARRATATPISTAHEAPPRGRRPG